MTKKIIALDLDGTLLRSDQTISDYSKETLKKVREAGHQVLIATGRPYRMAVDYYRQLELDTPMICFNGALTLMPDQAWSHELSRHIDRRYLFDLLKRTEDFELDFIASEYRRKFFVTLDKKELIDPRLFGLDELDDRFALLPERITSDPNALLAQTSNADRYAIADAIKAHFNHEIEVDSWGGPLNILEFAPKGVHKAFALQHVLRVMGKAAQDLVAFGDEHNDTEMLALAGQGYAMQNASPVLLDFADHQTTETNDQDGVAKQLEELFL